ncbi:hypothetical protein AA313_de0208514 [Arthrobotrys entomopaga]|nr:hypothetical protein AA313_de0208514 [Arthrobotrys entomopaga]
MANFSTPSTVIFLWALLSLSTVHAYFWGQVDAETDPDEFQEGWSPSWRGADYLGKCMSTEGKAGKLRSFGLVTGLLANRDTRGTIDDHNPQGFIFYKSKNCLIEGTDQVIVIRTKRDVETSNGGQTLYRGVQVFDLDNLSPIVNIGDFNSYEEISPESPEWDWVARSGIPDTEGMMVVYEATTTGALKRRFDRPVKTPPRNDAWLLFNAILNNKLQPVFNKLRVSLRDITNRRLQNQRVAQLDQMRTVFPGPVDYAGGGGIVYNYDNTQRNTGPGQIIPSRGPTSGSNNQGRSPLPGIPPLTMNQRPMMGQGGMMGSNLPNPQSRQQGQPGQSRRISLDPRDPDMYQLMKLQQERLMLDKQLKNAERLLAQQQRALHGTISPAYPQNIEPQQQQRQQQQVPERTQQNLSRGQFTRINDLLNLPQFGGGSEAPTVQNRIPASQAPADNENRMQEEQIPIPRENQAIEEEEPLPVNTLDFDFEPGRIPEVGPSGTFNQLFGQDLPTANQLPNLPGRPVLEIDTTADPLVESIYGDPRDATSFYPIRGWRGVPTSPTLRNQEKYREVVMFDAPAALRDLETRMNEFLENPPALIEEMRPYVPYDSKFTWPNSLMPPSDMPTMGRYEAPLAEPGSVREIGIEEQEHFPKFFDPQVVAGDMEEEFLNPTNPDERVDVLDFATRRLSTADQLFQDWRYKHIPILGNLQELPVSYYDPRWTAIQSTARQMIREASTDWKQYYLEKFRPIDEAYRDAVTNLRERFDALNDRRDAALEEIEKVKAVMRKTRQQKKLQSLQEEQDGLEGEIREIDARKERILDRRVKEDRVRAAALRDFEDLWAERTEDLQVRFVVWKDLAVYNIAKSQKKMMAEFGAGAGGLNN